MGEIKIKLRSLEILKFSSVKAPFDKTIHPIKRVHSWLMKNNFKNSFSCLRTCIMSLLPLLGVIIIFQGQGITACLPRRTKELTDSYLPVGIQALNHYKSQLQMYYPYIFAGFCQTGKHGAAIPQFPRQTDVCVADSVARINLFLIDLQREAAKRNLEDSQGLTQSVVSDVEKTSRMSASEQFHFILEKIQKEIENGRIGCKIREFLQDLRYPDSKLYRNMLNVKPLNYLD